MNFNWRGILVLISLILLSTAGCCYMVNDNESIELNDEFREKVGGNYIELSNGSVHYELKGPESGKIIVLVHGFSIPSYIWEPTFQYLSNAGFRVLRFDLYGRGLSDRPESDYGMQLYVNQLNELLKALDINEQINVIGLSMGGAVATHFINRYPDKVSKLVLIDPLIETPDRLELTLIKIPLLKDFLGKTVVVPKIRNGVTKAVYDPASFPNWKRLFEPQTTIKGYSRAIITTASNLAGKNFKSEYTKLAVSNIPVQLFWGKEDQTISFEDSKKVLSAIPNAEFHLIEKAGHLPHYEHPEIVNPLITEFLR